MQGRTSLVPFALERDRPRRAARSRLDAVGDHTRAEQPADGARECLPPPSLVGVGFALEQLEPGGELDAGRGQRGREVDRPSWEPPAGGEGEVERGDAVSADERGEESREERVVVGCVWGTPPLFLISSSWVWGRGMRRTDCIARHVNVHLLPWPVEGEAELGEHLAVGEWSHPQRLAVRFCLRLGYRGSQHPCNGSA